MRAYFSPLTAFSSQVSDSVRNGRITLVVPSRCFLRARVLQVLELDSRVLFMELTAGIEPATSPLIVSYPARDAIVRKVDKTCQTRTYATPQ